MFLKNKSQKIYEEAFNLVNALFTPQPDYIIFDFEKALINLIKCVFTIALLILAFFILVNLFGDGYKAKVTQNAIKQTKILIKLFMFFKLILR